MRSSTQTQGKPALDLNTARWWVGILAGIYLLLWLFPPSVELVLLHYVPMHMAMESVAIVVSVLVFGIAWHAYAEERPGNIVLIGSVLAGVALLDFAHMLSYTGMPDWVTPAGPGKAIVFWLAARYLLALGMLAIALLPWRPLSRPGRRYLVLGACLLYAGFWYWLELFHADLLPTLFVPGEGLTPLKVKLEYVLVGLYGVAALLFHRQAEAREDSNAPAFFAAAAITALSELCFTLYVSVSDLFNTTGHLFKIVAQAFLFEAAFVESVRQPFRALRVALNEERQLLAEQRSFVRTLDMLDEAVLELDLNGRVVSANQGWWRQLGVEADADITFADCLHQEDRETFQIQFRELVTGQKGELKGRFRLLLGDTPEHWMECRFVTEQNEAGAMRSARGVLRDITKSYLQERHITHMALHDALTNLPNRVLLEDRLKKAIELARRSGKRVAVCFIDLDHFKNINDTYGHKTGDALLIALARELKANLRAGDTLARWGGDEFVVLLPDVTDHEAVGQVAVKLSATMRRNFELDGLEVSLTFSMGVSVFPDDGEAPEVLLSGADRAMFYAKSQGRNNCQFFSDMSSKGLGRKELYIQARLAQAIRGGQIQVWFQPLVDARSALEAPRIVGLETLARWHDPDLGWISPGTFVPMAENLGLIMELGESVLRQALRRFQDWRETLPGLHLAVNVSKRQLFSPRFTETLLEDLARYAILPDEVVLEVTESVALMDVEYAEERLKYLAAAGFTLSIDDFGTGYASLSQLHELPVGELKIDISFVRRVFTPEGLRMVQAIVNLAQALHLRTVAEGIEDERTARALAELGVDVLQGYHFGRPCNAEELDVLLAANRDRRIPAGPERSGLAEPVSLE